MAEESMAVAAGRDQVMAHEDKLNLFAPSGAPLVEHGWLATRALLRIWRLLVIREPPSDPETSDDPAYIRWAAGVRSFLSPTYDTFRSWSQESAWRSDWRDNHRARGIDPAHAIHMERFNASQAPRPRVHEVRRRVRQLFWEMTVTGDSLQAVNVRKPV